MNYDLILQDEDGEEIATIGYAEELVEGNSIQRENKLEEVRKAIRSAIDDEDDEDEDEDEDEEDDAVDI